MYKSVLKQFLKAGFIFKGNLYPTEDGTPQGGIISPILANMALDGLQEVLRRKYQCGKSDKTDYRVQKIYKVNLMRYAADFVVTANTEKIAKEVKEVIKDFLKPGGLELSEEKTLITHIDNGTKTYITKQTQSNKTGERDYYPDRFKYDKKEDIYICSEGQKLYRTKSKAATPERIKYKNFRVCKNCPNKDKCTTSKKGRVITRSKHQDFLDTVDARTYDNMDKYKQRQMIVEHPFGTVKRAMNAGYFLTRGLTSVSAETDLLFTCYNLKRIINIVGVKELVKLLKERTALLFNKISAYFLILLTNQKICYEI